MAGKRGVDRKGSNGWTKAGSIGGEERENEEVEGERGFEVGNTMGSRMCVLVVGS